MSWLFSSNKQETPHYPSVPQPVMNAPPPQQQPIVLTNDQVETLYAQLTKQYESQLQNIAEELNKLRSQAGSQLGLEPSAARITDKDILKFIKYYTMLDDLIKFKDNFVRKGSDLAQKGLQGLQEVVSNVLTTRNLPSLPLFNQQTQPVAPVPQQGGKKKSTSKKSTKATKSVAQKKTVKKVKKSVAKVVGNNSKSNNKRF